MTTSLVAGRRVVGGERDDEGHRTYTVTHLVKSDNAGDGPYTVMNTSGLPAVGSLWNIGNDNDVWAFCYPSMKISPHELKEGEWVQFWKVEQKFSTKPLNRCQSTSIENPLSEPQQISGSFVKYTREATRDRFNNPIRSSSHEPFKGAQVEFDANRPNVRIGQNVGTLGLATFAQMIDRVNDSTLWGLPKRCVKLSNVSWERKLYGTCTYYYTRNFEFDISYESFDRFIIDEGNKVINGHWSPTSGEWVKDPIPGYSSSPNPNPYDPRHFIRAVDRAGSPIRLPLNGLGEPINISPTGTGNDLFTFKIEYYKEANFLSLGIPSTL